ncbi:MAG: chorismate mutase [Candidatus Thorarchaeota archaeon]
MLKLNDYRKDIDKIDEQMLQLFEKRLTIVKQIADLKNQQNLPIRDTKRESTILDDIAVKAEKLDLDPELAKRFLRNIIELSVEVEKKL